MASIHQIAALKRSTPTEINPSLALMTYELKYEVEMLFQILAQASPKDEEWQEAKDKVVLSV